MNRIHVIGGKNHGKTTLVGELLVELRARGLRVGAIKHTHHHHELDTPGKDSHRHRESGASVVGILSPGMNAVFWSNGRYGEGDDDPRYDSFAPMFAECDIVLVEGDSQTAAPKLEVWRSELGTPLLANRITGVRCVVTNDPLDRALPQLPRSDVSAVAEFVLHTVKD
ncbi:MAG: molybdopterin-guanine dinucleotide biosynthesis protein B [Planctomycetota bacterium]|nr:MAG: molybdopterin-guanine dinucleotide biosynthesis protein B [Planctomycetota bacterium]